MAMVESSFLTSISADQKKARQTKERREELLEKMKCGQDILSYHTQLQELADDLDGQVESKLTANENAFFVAYSHHMFHVRNEFQELRQRADEEETKTRRDAKIQSLEKELDWFMHEALRLDELCKKYKKDLDKWKGKAEALEDDSKFLEDQIKGAKKNNKTLRNAVEKAQTSAYAALVSTEESGIGGGATLPVAPPASASTMPEEGSAGRDGAQMLALENTASNGLSPELEQRYQHCVKHLQQQLQAERKQAAKMRSMADRQIDEASELEHVFMQCVEQVREEITERRRVTAEQTERLKKGELGLRRARAKQAAEDASASAQPSAATLDDFTVADRRKIVDLLLSSDQVIQFLYEKLFPQGHMPGTRSTTL
eukprot:CAMPEP_0117551616 /NCGR_PEP_ID=MMETSP0784-20121206/49282_1 /TAXON_ID=39447 /ORGANISM="" /LENGTH=371 /DNA_ID=CAMNT_0005348659 /DNA_START=120 /DNA_END=1235 /DNA_ORIENTATION=+